MVSFTNEEQKKLYELGLNLDFNMDFVSDKIDLSCYKSNDTLYHLLHGDEDREFNNFEDMILKIKEICFYWFYYLYLYYEK